MHRALLGVAIATVAFSGVVSAQNTFCERYATTEAAAQFGLISNVVGRAVLGASAATTGSVAVTGLVNEPNNRGYFNGTLPPNFDYTNANNSAALGTLATHLYKFFTLALGCRNAAGNVSYAWSPVQMYRLHSAMGITPTVMGAFITEVATSLVTFGVQLGSASSPSSEISFLSALLSQFNRYPTNPSSTTTIFGNGLQICTAASCPLAQQIAQFHVDDSNVISQIGVATTSATINQGDYVNFRFGTAGGVTQTDSATSTMALTSGLVSTPGERTYTVQMNTPGTYYFYSTGAPSGVHATITVSASSSSGSMSGSSGMTGMSTGGGTSGNTAAASATLGFATVLAVAAAAAAIVA